MNEFFASVAIGHKIKTKEGKFYRILIIEGAVIFFLRLLLFIELLFLSGNKIQTDITNIQPSFTVKLISAVLIVSFTYFIIDRGYIFYYRKRRANSINFISFLFFLVLIIASSIYLATAHMTPFLKGVVPTEIKQPYSFLLIFVFFVYVIFELFPVIAELIFERQRNAVNQKLNKNFSARNKKHGQRHDFQSVNMNIPSSIKLYFHQYLNFFKEYVKLSKGQNIELEIVETKLGLQIKINPDSNLTIEQLTEWLEEYINYTRDNISGIKINFEKEATEYEADLLIAKLENQITNLQNSLRIVKLENKLLNDEKDFLRKIAYNIVTPMIAETSIKTNNRLTEKIKFKEQLKVLIGNGKIKQVLNDSIEFYSKEDRGLQRELIFQKAKFTEIEKQRRNNQITNEEFLLAQNEVVYAVLHTLDSEE